MWCSSCGAEYRPGFTRCPDCDIDLVAEEPAQPEPTRAPSVFSGLDLARLGPDPVVVYVAPRPEAEMMRSVLEGSGIASAIRVSGLETYGVMLPASLLVRADDAERANEIVLAARTGDLDLMLDETDEELDEEPEAWDADPAPAAPSSDPIAAVTPWWKHPELPALLTGARVVLALGAVVGLAYLLLTLLAD